MIFVSGVMWRSCISAMWALGWLMRSSEVTDLCLHWSYDMIVRLWCDLLFHHLSSHVDYKKYSIQQSPLICYRPHKSVTLINVLFYKFLNEKGILSAFLHSLYSAEWEWELLWWLACILACQASVGLWVIEWVCAGERCGEVIRQYSAQLKLWIWYEVICS